MRSYIELTKPRITWLILMSTGIGFWAGAESGWNALALLYTLIGTGLLASGTAVLNQWYERESDAKMARTRQRPLPAGRISPARALAFGIALSLAGFSGLWFGVNLLAALLGVFTVVAYLLAYTPLKRVSSICTSIGAIPGAMPPLIGYAAAAGRLDGHAWVLYAILFLWQFPHFLSIAWIYRDDYARGGLAMLPSEAATARQILISSLLLIPVSIVAGGGMVYSVAALVLGLAYFAAAARAASQFTRRRAHQLLLTSVTYLPVLYMFLLFDKR